MSPVQLGPCMHVHTQRQPLDGRQLVCHGGQVGDILVTGEMGAQILVAADLVSHFEQSLTQVCASCAAAGTPLLPCSPVCTGTSSCSLFQ